MQTSFTVSAISNHFICSPLPRPALPLSTIITYTSDRPRPPLFTQFYCKVSTFNRQARARKNDDDQIAAPQLMTRKMERTPSWSVVGGEAQPEAEFQMAINNYFEKSVAILYGSVIQYARTFAD